MYEDLYPVDPENPEDDMPSKSKAQARFMAMCAHMEAPPENCPPDKVSREFNQADKVTGILKGKKKGSAK